MRQQESGNTAPGRVFALTQLLVHGFTIQN